MKVSNATIFCLLTGFSIASFAGHLPPRWFYNGHTYLAKNKESFTPLPADIKALERGESLEPGDVRTKAEAALSNPNRIALQGFCQRRYFSNETAFFSILYRAVKTIGSFFIQQAFYGCCFRKIGFDFGFVFFTCFMKFKDLNT